MNFKLIIIAVLLMLIYVWVANAGGTILIKKGKKGDLIIIKGGGGGGGGGKGYGKQEVVYKYIPVPVFMPKMTQQIPQKMPIVAKAVEAQVIEAMTLKGGAPIMSQPIEYVQYGKGGGMSHMPEVIQMPIKGMGGGGAEWWRRK